MADPRDEASLDVWGFRDTAFRLFEDGVVRVSGSRYAISGRELPDLLPWVRRIFHPDVSPLDRNPSVPPVVPAPNRNEPFIEVLRKHLASDQISEDPRLRLRHGHGHTQQEIWAVKHGGGIPRVPDLVVWPTSELQIEEIVQAAVRHDVCLVPYGGGTSVTGALRCPQDESRSIVSVDLRRMNRVLWIDSVNHLALIEAGATGREIASVLARHGFTLGHEPDSIEFSTLGGWIATHASGMKKNRYGNIEDLVLDVTVVSARGRIERQQAGPRESIGSGDARRWMFGSEGCLGIVTRALVKIFPLPERTDHGSLLFPDFERGVSFLYDLQCSGLVPASVRLVDNLQFQLAQMMKPRATGLDVWKRAAQRAFVTRIRGFDVERMVACTLLFEGDRAAVARESRHVARLARRHGGLSTGAENGRRGYELTFAIAYIRDWIMDHWLLGESFETSIAWDSIVPLCERVKQRIEREHAQRRLPGRPFVTSRVTQLYDTGVCVYFYLAYYCKGAESPSAVYEEIEHAARDEVLRCGGSISHHHGIGKIRQPFLQRVLTPAALECARSFKTAVDPENVFGAANQLFGAAGSQSD